MSFLGSIRHRGVLAVPLFLGLAATVTGGPINGTIYYTTYNPVATPNGNRNVWKVDYNYDGTSTFGLSK